VSLGQDIAAALPELRAQAESLMQDACTITVPGEGRGPWNDETGTYDPPAPVTLYSGKCRVRQPNTSGNTADAGEATFSVSDRIVSIPLSGSGYASGVVGIPVHATVTMTAVSPVGDPAMVGKAFTYLSPASQQTHPTARRMRCKEVD
jgi:hypothetical protein